MKNKLMLTSLLSILALASGCAQDGMSKAASAKDSPNAVLASGQTVSGSGSSLGSSSSSTSSSPAGQAQAPVVPAPVKSPAAVPAVTIVLNPSAGSSSPSATPKPSSSTLDLSTGIGMFLNQLYKGLFNRAPDVDGFNYWVNANAMGFGCNALAQSFLLSSENSVQRSAAIAGNALDEIQYIQVLYRGLLGREADSDGLSFWFTAMVNKSVDVAALERNISQSAEFKNRCSGLGLAQ